MSGDHRYLHVLAHSFPPRRSSYLALLAPLIRAALGNSLVHGFAGLSGPLLRGDARTIGNHLTALANDSPALLPVYVAMARATLDELKRRETSPSARLTALGSLPSVPQSFARYHTPHPPARHHPHATHCPPPPSGPSSDAHQVRNN